MNILTLRIGIIGTGGFAMMHAQKLAALANVEVIGFVASTIEKAETAANKFGQAKGYESLQQMLDDSKVDAVYICVPPFAHGAYEHLLVERGIPFFVEKPIDTTEQQPAQLVQQIKEKQLITSVGYHWRYKDTTAKAKQLLEQQTIGLAAGYWMGGLPGVYWWRNMELSGGQMVEQTTHIVDLLRYTAGEVVEVYAAYGTHVVEQQYADATVPDVGTMTLKLASGAVATISNTCILPAGGRTGLHLYTDKGRLEIDGSTLIVIDAEKSTTYQKRNDPYDLQSAAFIHALRTGDTSRILSNYEDAFQTHRVTMAANQSAASGQPVRLV
ncbi:Gfo/Idh/MocA family protein [Paenibacillus yanchengensis]|uniref:Gfo/Idh/MocA family protein n=1 Tax=Paenibacillus yanchengensis TaxID=2035833 RepID=A0ABW4YGI6_9BACL